MKSDNVILLDCFGLFAADPLVTFFDRHYGKESKTLKDHFCQGADLGEVDLSGFLDNLHRELGLDKEKVMDELREIGKIDPEMMGLAKRLKESHEVILLSNCIQGMMEEIFGGSDFHFCFDKLYLSYEIGLIKPYRPIYDLVMKDIGKRDGQIVFFDDNPTNIPEAINAGIDAILFESIEQMKAELTKRGLL